MKLDGIKKKIHITRDQFLKLLSEPSKLFVILVYSLIFNFLAIILNYSIFKSIGSNVSFFSLVIFVPLMQLILTLPISLNGIGIREFSYLAYFESLGIPSYHSIAVSIISYMISITVGTIGWFFYLKRGHDLDKQ